MRPEGRASASTYAGLFLVTLATLMYEILLTRIFSVTMWYHFAFVAISMAMFGMTVGALIVYLAPGLVPPARSHEALALSASFLAVTIPASFLTHLSIPFRPELSVLGLYAVGLTYAAIAVPFVFSGIGVCVALTRFPGQVSALYGADLAGAAFGCLGLIVMLDRTDAPTVVLLTACCAGAGSLCFAAGPVAPALRWMARVVAAGLALAGLASAVLAAAGRPPVRIVWVKGAPAPMGLLYDKWNSFSYLRVFGDPGRASAPFGWGLSARAPRDAKIPQLGLDIDAGAGSVLTRFAGRLDDVDFLRYDVTNLAHYLRPRAAVLVVGTGGGRDILSALAFGQRSVLGVEINGDILATVNGRFGDFTGHLDRLANVELVNDEARSYLARSRRAFDVIQVSLIDTWAATAAGAFVLTENSLYTVEAWKLLLERLTPHGILTVSRWYFRDRPGEVLRLVSLARAALVAGGVRAPRGHIAVVGRLADGGDGGSPDGVGTILVGREPFADGDLATLGTVTRELGFTTILSPTFAREPTFAALAGDEDPSVLQASFPIDISPPTDDRPFFFNMLRLRDVLDTRLWEQGIQSMNLQAVSILGALLVVVVGLTIACIVVPLALTLGRAGLAGSLPLVGFFVAIGLGFMLVEISQLQRLIVFLGHPTYGLTVVLFALLLAGGVGSYATGGIPARRVVVAGLGQLTALLGVLILFGVLTPRVIARYAGATTGVRILVATAILIPLGLGMGMAFPLGMRLAARHSAALTPWLWGVNGACSVCASVLAVAISLGAGIAAAFWTGWACYGAALLAFACAARGRPA